MASEIERSPVILTVAGFIAIFVAVSVCYPLAFVGGLRFIVALIRSSLFVAYSLGDVMAFRAGWIPGSMGILLLGFVILQVLVFIPLLGTLVQGVAISRGFGGLLSALRGFWPSGTGECET